MDAALRSHSRAVPLGRARPAARVQGEAGWKVTMADPTFSGRSGLLVSIRDVAEAKLALSSGADVINLEPSSADVAGDSGLSFVTDVARFVAGRRIVSASIADVPAADAAAFALSAMALATAGADHIRVRLPASAPRAEQEAVIASIAAAPLGAAHPVAVLFADGDVEAGLLPVLASAGFAGVMLEVSEHGSGRLLDHATAERLSALAEACRQNGLFLGVGGSLRLADIPSLVQAGVGLLGFRGAACEGPTRNGRLSATRIHDLRTVIDRAAARHGKAA